MKSSQPHVRESPQTMLMMMKKDWRYGEGKNDVGYSDLQDLRVSEMGAKNNAKTEHLGRRNVSVPDVGLVMKRSYISHIPMCI